MAKKTKKSTKNLTKQSICVMHHLANPGQPAKEAIAQIMDEYDADLGKVTEGYYNMCKSKHNTGELDDNGKPTGQKGGKGKKTGQPRRRVATSQPGPDMIETLKVVKEFLGQYESPEQAKAELEAFQQLIEKTGDVKSALEAIDLIETLSS